MSNELDLGSETDEHIDYLHPDGKPAAHEKGSKLDDDDDDDGKSKGHSYQKALDEADGHSMQKPDPFLHGDSKT